MNAATIRKAHRSVTPKLRQLPPPPLAYPVDMDDPQPQSIPWRKWLRNAGITLGVLLLLTLTFYLNENVRGEST